MSSEIEITKEDLNKYLNEMSKEYKKLGGRKIPVEVILVGGAAVVERYGFRGMTMDVDVKVSSSTLIKEAANIVGDRYGLPNRWFNADFMQTKSYSPHISEYSVPFRIFNQVLIVRMVVGEYQVAMKLMAGRKYKNDMSDIVGILAEQERMGNPIRFDMVDKAMHNLYGGW